LTGRAGLAADALLARLRRYMPLAQLLLGAQSHALPIFELAIMLRAPLRYDRDAPRWCAQCSKTRALMEARERTKWCSRCSCVTYCGRECQRAHWRGGHKRLCAALAAYKGGGAGGGGGGVSASDAGSSV
jgi:MYND finger